MNKSTVKFSTFGKNAHEIHLPHISIISYDIHAYTHVVYIYMCVCIYFS